MRVGGKYTCPLFQIFPVVLEDEQYAHLATCQEAIWGNEYKIPLTWGLQNKYNSGQKLGPYLQIKKKKNSLYLLDLSAHHTALGLSLNQEERVLDPLV